MLLCHAFPLVATDRKSSMADFRGRNWGEMCELLHTRALVSSIVTLLLQGRAGANKSGGLSKSIAFPPIGLAHCLGCHPIQAGQV
jgi:hypothetical protein